MIINSLPEGQSQTGRYDTRNDSHTNSKHYEELILNSDSTFSYLTRMEFVKIKKEGKWLLNADTLILTETNPCCKDKIIVGEERSRSLSKGRIRFLVTSLLGDDINYHLVFTNVDSTQIIWATTGITELKVKKLKKFHFIVNSLLYSPEYVVKSPRSNVFKVRLAPSRFFFNEKWLIRNGKIVPLGWDNKYAIYYLDKKD